MDNTRITTFKFNDIEFFNLIFTILLIEVKENYNIHNSIFTFINIIKEKVLSIDIKFLARN